MELLSLSQDAVEGLSNRGIPRDAELPVRLVVTALEDICHMVAEDCGPDRYDSAQSEGQLRYWRTRKRIIKELRREHPELVGVRAVETDNALQLAHGDCLVSFYAARDGVESPRLSMGSKTQRTLVDQMQLQLAGTWDGPALLRLAVLYEADGNGLVEVAVGVLDSPKEWHWRVVVYRRADDEGRPLRRTLPTAPTAPAYDQQPVPELPAITPKRRRAEAEGGAG